MKTLKAIATLKGIDLFVQIYMGFSPSLSLMRLSSGIIRKVGNFFALNIDTYNPFDWS